MASSGSEPFYGDPRRRTAPAVRTLGTIDHRTAPPKAALKKHAVGNSRIQFRKIYKENRRDPPRKVLTRVGRRHGKGYTAFSLLGFHILR